MSGLDIFALIVLITLIVCFLALWALLGMYPGKIARQRNHPQADAISVCGWCGAITMGVLSPLAFVWAFTNPATTLSGKHKPVISVRDQNEASQAGEEKS
jgi:fatty acid desaturase